MLTELCDGGCVASLLRNYGALRHRHTRPRCHNPHRGRSAATTSLLRNYGALRRNLVARLPHKNDNHNFRVIIVIIIIIIIITKTTTIIINLIIT